MKEHDLLDAVGQVSDETVQKYALPDAKTLGTADVISTHCGQLLSTMVLYHRLEDLSRGLRKKVSGRPEKEFQKPIDRMKVIWYNSYCQEGKRHLD